MNSKDFKEGYIPLNWKAWLKARQARVQEKGLSTTALWLSKFDRPLTTRSIRNLVKKYLHQAGIKDASVHTLRHTMATHLPGLRRRLKIRLGYVEAREHRNHPNLHLPGQEGAGEDGAGLGLVGSGELVI